MRFACLLAVCSLLVLGLLGCQSDQPAERAVGEAPLVRNDLYADWPDYLPTPVRSTPRDKNSPKFGPPPPGYIRITGEPVPGWKPSDMQRPAPSRNPWWQLGPRPIIDERWSGYDDASGRVVSIAPHPVDPDVVYIASASGGIWKTVDGGQLWEPLTDELPILNHGAVAVDPSNPDTVYAGTGEYTTQSQGDGLFRSTDGGQTWERIATTAQVGTTCTGVVVDPTDPQRIHVTGNAGYARTTDGGQTWSLLGGDCSSLAVNPQDPNILYIAQYADGVYRSTNAGQSFTKLATLTGPMSRIIITLAPSNPDVLYVALVYGSSLRAMYRSADGGDTWSRLGNTPDFPYPQAWYDCCLAVDPLDENVVYAGGVFPTYAVAGVIRSTDGGQSWTDITIDGQGGQLHPDMHWITFGPEHTLWVGNDGGVWKSADGGDTWINTNATLTVTQNYNIALHPTDPNRVMGGTQDNGTIERFDATADWPQVLSGDGGFMAYDQEFPERRYGTYVYLTVYRIDGDVWTDITGPWGADPKNFIAPLVMDPNDSSRLYGGTHRVWRTYNADTDADWVAISPDVAGGTTLNAIAVAPSDQNVIYTGSANGLVHVTLIGYWTWYNRSDGLPSGEISDIYINPTAAGTAYVAFFNTSGPRVLRTADYGVTWTDVTGTLPTGVAGRALEVDWRFDPPGLWLGSGSGVYWSYDHGQTWTKDGTDLPNVNIGDLQIDWARLTITAGTYGRGAWRRNLPPVMLSGDANCDGSVDFADIQPFVRALDGEESYLNFYPNCLWLNADIDGDGLVTFDDVSPFVELISP